MHQTCDPKHARKWFAFRKPIAWIASAGTVALLIFVLTPFIPFFAALLISLTASACLFFFYLDNWTIGFQCPKCGGYIEPNITPWICPNKDTPHRNDQVDEYPFINECQHCQSKPKTYQCHHCRELIYLTKDQQKTAYARCADVQTLAKPKPVVKKDRHAEALAEKRRSIELRQLDVQDKQLAVDLRGLDQALAPEKSVEQRYRAELKDEDDELRLRAKIDKEYADDEETRKRRHLMVDRIMREKL